MSHVIHEMGVSRMRDIVKRRKHRADVRIGHRRRAQVSAMYAPIYFLGLVARNHFHFSCSSDAALSPRFSRIHHQ